MSFKDYLVESLRNDDIYCQLVEEFDLDEGMMDMAKKFGKFLPIFGLLFQLFVSSPMASPVAKNDIRVALINMQEAKNKDTLDAAAEEVKNLLSTLKGENRGKFLKLFQKAYQQTSEKVGS